MLSFAYIYIYSDGISLHFAAQCAAPACESSDKQEVYIIPHNGAGWKIAVAPEPPQQPPNRLEREIPSHNGMH